MNLPFGADKNPSAQGGVQRYLFLEFFSPRECVCVVSGSGSLPTSLVGLLTPLWDESMLPETQGLPRDRGNNYIQMNSCVLAGSVQTTPQVKGRLSFLLSRTLKGCALWCLLQEGL